MAGASSRNFKLIKDYGPGFRVPFVNGGTALYEGDMATITSNVLAEVADNNTVGVAGICAEDIPANATGVIYTGGQFEGSAATGTDFGLGAKVYNASASTLDAGSQNDVPAGKVLPPDPSSGGTVRFELWSILRGDVDAHA